MKIEDKVLLALLTIRDLFAEGHWTKGTFGRTADMRPCSSHDRDAVYFCLIGAINASAEPLKLSIKNWIQIEILLRKQIPKIDPNTPSDSLLNFNDRHTSKDVIALLDHAIEERLS